MSEHCIVPIARVERTIRVLRGRRVILDADLATLYGVSTKRLNEQVKRNTERFPTDFLFRLTSEEQTFLGSQFATLETGRGKHRKSLPWAFTEHGAIMAASVLNSPTAIEMSIWVVRAFVHLRSVLATHGQLSEKLEELERRLTSHDRQIVVLFDAIRKLMAPPAQPRRRIGFSEGE